MNPTIIEQGKTFTLYNDERAVGGLSITCHVCGLTSYNENDAKQSYCPQCHQWHDFLAQMDEATLRAESYIN